MIITDMHGHERAPQDNLLTAPSFFEKFMIRNNQDFLNALIDEANELNAAIHRLNSIFPGVANIPSWKNAIYTAQSEYSHEVPDLADYKLYVATRWIDLAERNCLDVRMDHTRGLIVKEKPAGDSEQRKYSSDVIRIKLRKMLFNLLNDRQANRSLQMMEFMTRFETAANESLKSYLSEFIEVVEELKNKSYINEVNSGSRMPLFFRGIAFDDWQVEMTTKVLQPSLSHAATSTNQTFVFNAAVAAVQTGAQSVAYVQQSTDQNQFAELKKALESALSDISKSNISDETREDAKELILNTIAEIEKEKPNKFSLNSLVQGVAGMIQTLGSTEGAYNAIKVAAAVVGIPIP